VNAQTLLARVWNEASMLPEGARWGDIYEGLLARNAEDVKSGAGQCFTPRPVIEVRRLFFIRKGLGV